MRETGLEVIQQVGMALRDETDRAEQQVFDCHFPTAGFGERDGGGGRKRVGHGSAIDTLVPRFPADLSKVARVCHTLGNCGGGQSLGCRLRTHGSHHRMHVLIVNRSRVPVVNYGGTERVIWGLARCLTQRGHTVTFLVPEGSTCDFARVLPFDRKAPILPQIPRDVDIVHFQFPPDLDPDEAFDLPYLVTEHANPPGNSVRPLNTVFVSRDHARRHHSDQFVYNGLDWDSYGPVDFAAKRDHYHFLGKAAWSVKNIKGAIAVAEKARVPLAVLGGSRLNLSRGFRFTFSPRARFHGMVGGRTKADLLNRSRGHIFPVRWEEPFGLAMIESLYFGCPVFGTPYGSLNEMIGPDVGALSHSAQDLVDAMHSGGFDPRRCHDYVRETFTAAKMTADYLARYETILNGHSLQATRPYIGGKPKGLLPWTA